MCTANFHANCISGKYATGDVLSRKSFGCRRSDGRVLFFSERYKFDIKRLASVCRQKVEECGDYTRGTVRHVKIPSWPTSPFRTCAYAQLPCVPFQPTPKQTILQVTKHLCPSCPINLSRLPLFLTKHLLTITTSLFRATGVAEATIVAIFLSSLASGVGLCRPECLLWFPRI